MNKKDPNEAGKGLSIKAVPGKSGFLFLGGRDSNNVFEFMSGNVQISLSAVEVHRANFAALAQASAPSVYFVAPEAHVIYDDLLPEGFCVSASRPVNVLRSIFPDRIVYPEESLRAARAAGMVVYSGRDSHWAETAAAAGYQTMRADQGLTTPFESPNPPDANRELCDLMIEDIGEARREFAAMMKRLCPEGCSEIYENGVVNHGRLVIRLRPSSPHGRCLVFGTSFSRFNFNCYAMDYREVVFCHATAFDPLLAALVAPEHIYLEQPERFLPFPMASVPGSTLLSHALMAAPDIGGEADGALPEGPVGRLIALLAGLAQGHLPPPADLPPGGTAFVDRLRHLQGLTLDPVQRDAMRTILAGSFRRDDLMRYLNSFIDQGAFRGLPHLLPETEMGRLGRVRIHILASRWADARAELLAACVFGASTESRYYENYLRGR